MTVVVCQYCKKGNEFLDDAEWGFDCKQCGKYNEADTYQIIREDRA